MGALESEGRPALLILAPELSNSKVAGAHADPSWRASRAS